MRRRQDDKLMMQRRAPKQVFIIIGASRIVSTPSYARRSVRALSLYIILCTFFFLQNIILDYNNNDTSNILLLFIVWEEVLDAYSSFRVSGPQSKLDVRLYKRTVKVPNTMVRESAHGAPALNTLFIWSYIVLSVL